MNEKGKVPIVPITGTAVHPFIQANSQSFSAYSGVAEGLGSCIRVREHNPAQEEVRVCCKSCQFIPYRHGSLAKYGFSFGMGKYGDLEATVAAVVLGREMTPFSGSIREPIAKAIGFMRAPKFKSGRQC